MASTRVINRFLTRGIYGNRNFLLSHIPSTSSCYAYLPCNFTQVKSYSKVKQSDSSVTNVDRKTSDQVQVGFAEVGNFFLYEQFNFFYN